MADMSLYCRTDGMLEPRSDKAIQFVKDRAGQMIIGDFAYDTRSSLQNRYLNGWVYSKQIVHKLNEAGILLDGKPWTRDTIHAAFQDCFLVKQEYILNGRHVKVYESTASMSKKRFSEYIDEQIKPFVWGMWEITIDDPRDGFYLELMREIQR